MPKLTITPGQYIPILGNTRKLTIEKTPSCTCPAVRVEVGQKDNWEAIVLLIEEDTIIQQTEPILSIENLGDVNLIADYEENRTDLQRAFPLAAIPDLERQMPSQNDAHVPEALPEHIRAKLERKNERLKNANLPDNVSQLVLNNFARWNTGILTVSFKGGTAELHRKIAERAREWSKYGNIQFDFGEPSPQGPYRQWIPNDRSNIRIGFDQPGYWSMVGTQSMDGSLMVPGEISMNFQNFDLGLPGDWEKVVLHEFGHALGFEHEHQSPESTCDFDWDYIYSYYSRTQGWTRQTTDANMALLINDRNQFTTTPYDQHSIMHYWFPQDFFLSKQNSSCFVAAATELSASDKALMAEVYPFNGTVEFQRDLATMPTLRNLATNRKLSDADKRHYQSHLEFKAQRLMKYLEETCKAEETEANASY